MKSEATRTAGEAILQIQTTLRNLTGTAGLGILPDPDPLAKPAPAVVPRDYDIHKLSTVSLARSRSTLAKSLEILKLSVLARETWSDSAAERLLRVKGDTAAKHRLANASKNALAACRRIANSSDPFATRPRRAMHRLQSIAEDAGASTYIEDPLDDTSQTSYEIIVSGTKFMVDFCFRNLATQTIDVKVNFRFLGENNNERTDPAVSHSFATLLREEKFDQLRRAFDIFIAVERLSESNPSISLCDALRAFEDDLLSAQEIERKAVGPDVDRTRLGHGLVERTALGLRLTFMPGQSALLGVEQSVVHRHISVSRSRLLPKQPAPGRPNVSPVELFEFGDGDMANVSAQYVIVLERAVLVSLSVAQVLERVTGAEEAMKAALRAGTLRGNTVRELSAVRDTRSDHNERRGYWPNLQRLLAPRMFGHDVIINDEGEDDDDDGKPVVKEKVHWSQQGTEFVASTALPGGEFINFSHSGADVIGAVALHRIPVCQPRHIAPVLGILRQQIVFNELFRSCFAYPTRAVEGMRFVVRQAVEVACDAPHLLQFSIEDGVTDDMMSMLVNIGVGGILRVNLSTSSGGRPACSDRKATAALQLTRSIPLAIQTIVKVGRRANTGAPLRGASAG